MAFGVGSGSFDGHGGGGGEQVGKVALTRKSFFLCMSVTLLVLVVAIVVRLMI